MSDFASKIINWTDSEFENIKWGSNSAFQDIFGFIIGFAKEKKNIKVLDLGCGDGGQWNWYFKYKKCFNFSLDITGYEPFKNNATPSGSTNSEVIKIFDNLEECREKFDVVLCMSVLEHVYDRKKFLRDCYRLMHTGGYALINFDNGHFFNPKEWKRNILGKFLAHKTPLKRYYQDFVDVDNIIKIAQNLGMEVDHNIDYHLFIQKPRLKLLNLCDSKVRTKIMDKIQKFEREVSDIIKAKDNKMIHNKYIYSSTLVLKK